jgi:GYF domain 2
MSSDFNRNPGPKDAAKEPNGHALGRAWYVSRDSGVAGPYTKAEVVKRIADGNITSTARVRNDAAEEWRPIEASIFADAFGTSNPYRNPPGVKPEASDGRSLFLWLAAVAVLLVMVIFFASPLRPEQKGRLLGEVVGRALGGIMLGGLVASVWAMIRPKRDR